MQQKISFPNNITYSKGATAHAKVLTIEPCFPGYGTTIGNALRRVLLSSLSGGAIVAVKIKDAKHEFDTVKYIKEDMLEIILNLKNIHFKVHNKTDEPIKLSVSVSGEKEVTAADIQKNSDVEVANPSQVICHLTDKAAELEMELFVEVGMGYSPTESRHQEKLELGTIAIDAIFSPVLNCSFEVENVRVGELTNYDKVIMNVQTDGTVSAEVAVKEASQILIDHFMLLTGEKEVEVIEKDLPEVKAGDEKPAETPGEDVDATVELEKEEPKEEKNKDSEEENK